MDLVARLGNLATGGKIVRIEGQWTGANHAVMRRAIRRISVISSHTLLAVIATRRVLTVRADASATITGIGMAIAVAGYAVAAIWSVLNTMIAWRTVLARVSGIAGRALTFLDSQELIFARAIGILVGQRQIDIGELRVQRLLPVVGPYEDHPEITQSHHEVGTANGLARLCLEVAFYHLQSILETQIAAGLLIALMDEYMILAEQYDIRCDNGLAHKARCEVEIVAKISAVCRYMTILIKQII